LGGVYSYIRVLPDEFLLNFFVFKFISNEISRAEHEYMNIPPPAINALVTPLLKYHLLFAIGSPLFRALIYGEILGLTH
jgi:hypothetical protein